MKNKNYLVKYLSVFFVLFFCSDVAFAENPSIIGNPENATWEIYTDTSEVQCMTFSDDRNILWVGT
ncbi:MAG: hypothetical protein HQK62_14600, partial [Desulfamplus sp.]|nr:hypothetical protein [Desulfamplus sp.]